MVHGDLCPQCSGARTIAIPAAPYTPERHVSAQDQARARIRDIRSAMDVAEAMLDNLPGAVSARTLIDTSRTLTGRAKSFEALARAAVRESAREERGEIAHV